MNTYVYFSIPFWIPALIILLIIYQAPRIWLRIGEIGGWFCLIGAPFIGELLGKFILDTVESPLPFSKEILSTIVVSYLLIMGFSAIYTCRLYIWASGNKSSDISSTSKTDIDIKGVIKPISIGILVLVGLKIVFTASQNYINNARTLTLGEPYIIETIQKQDPTYEYYPDADEYEYEHDPGALEEH